MSKISRKLIISVAVLICFLAGVFTLLSYSLADDPPSSTSPVASLSGSSVNQMDRIIDNSLNGTYGDPNYYVLEISSGPNPSALSTLISEAPSRFKNLIIDAYALDQTKKMADNSFTYEFLRVNTPDTNLLEAIKRADFIYIANDPNNQYTRTLDFSEDVKNALVNAATVDYKPVVIDSFSKTQAISIADQKSIAKLIQRDFSEISTTYRQPEDGGSGFMDLSSSSYYFIPIHGDYQKDKWGTDKTAKILAIGKDDTASNYTMSAAMGLDVNNPGKNPLSNSSVLYTKGYYTREAKPSNVEYSRVSIANLETFVNSLPADSGIDTFDYVILEKGISDTITDSQYAILSSIAMTGVHFLYASSYTIKTQTYNTVNPANAYAYILDKLVTVDDHSRYSNVLVCSSARMATYAKSKSMKAEKDIADIILNGSFRGVSGPDSGGDSSTVYTVLEIEPGYPIDMDLAKAFGNSGIIVDQWGNSNTKDNLSKSRFKNNGNEAISFELATGRDGSNPNNSEYGIYYLRNSAVRDDTTADEISFGDNVPLSNYGNDSTTRTNNLTNRVNALKDKNELLCDYYNWTLSKAKIAHATGLSYNDVKVVHMSVAEFNTSTKSLLDNYDAIFIGGDISSIKASNYWNKANPYLMYSKYGEEYSSNDFGTNSFSGTSTGNDISANKLTELNDYAEKLPVIVEKNVTNGSGGISTQIDPSSNMYSFLNGIIGNSLTLWGFDSSKTIKITNYEKKYGNTVGEYATVFAGLDQFAYDAVDDTMVDLNYNRSSTLGKKDVVDLRNILKTQRPKFVVKTRPAEYVEGDATTTITKDNLKWTYDINGASSYNVNLYIDNNSDGKFSSNEVKAHSDSNALAYTELSDDFSGPLYWKLEVVTSTGKKDSEGNDINLTSSVTGLSKIALKKKQQVHLLQIMPIITGGDNTEDTLYLCTECQHSRRIVHGGLWAGNNTWYGKACASGLVSDGIKYQDVGLDYPKNILNAQTKVANTINTYETARGGTWVYSQNANNLGTHTHNFGIVKYSDNRTQYKDHDKTGSQIHNEGGDWIGLDDWHTNWFDDVKNDYDVKLDILSIEQYQALCTKVNNIYKDCKTEDEIQSKRQTYVDAYTQYKLYYDCMVEVVNGTFNSTKDISDVNKQIFRDMLQNDMKLGASFSAGKVTYVNGNPTAAQVESLIDGYGKAGDLCCDQIDKYYNQVSAANTSGKVGGYTEYVKQDLDYLKDKSVLPNDRKLYDYYSIFEGAAGNDNAYKNCLEDFTNCYVPWRDAKALEQYFYDKYIENLECASVYNETDDGGNLGDKLGTFKLSGIWNCIAIGAADNFGSKDINILGCYTLINYIKDNKNLILFHDCLVAEGAPSNGNAGTVNMSKYLSSDFGLSGDSTVSLVYNHNTNQVEEKTAVFTSDPNGAPVGGKTITNRMLNSKMSGSSGAQAKYSIGTYKFVQYDKQAETNNQSLHASHDSRASFAARDGYAPTDKAEQTNEGIITKYPFTIGDRLQISPTNAQGYAANVNSPKMTVYYTLEGGTVGSFSSMFAADPHDGINNYFLYQYGNIYYTGAGHSLITGRGRNNNDERRLFINIILNSARPSVDGPSLNLYDYDSTLDDVPASLKNKKVKVAIDADEDENSAEVDKEEYVYYVDSQYDTPQFSIYPQLGSGASIESLTVFYDVKNDGESKNVYDEKSADVMIYSSPEDKDADVSSKLLKKMSGNTDNLTNSLTLKPEYFTGKDGTAAYICVTVVDSAGNPPMTKTIRIELKPELLELD